MSDKGFERSDKMSVDYISHARGMSEYILNRSYRGAGDTVEAAMHRAERRFGVPATWLHRLRYRNIKDMPVSAYGAIVRAYELACQASEKAYETERELAHARNSKLIGLSDLVAGKEAPRVDAEIPALLDASDEANKAAE
ncbi:hypothetical protein [Pseudochrobactrum sp. XF203]|uniref:hypothetical protein n=1 Tax=Pseudochrobactrum sp. XF203 TaxID=2879116 RepID=UPI001CE23A04|nr:hypothetical protein [Pseudochrobactrum sp. XF203]UCA47711.1 hypothetical protein LDL70_16820 [Pseudochrobactrum sp. XF203]